MMDKNKTKAQLINELEELRKRIASQEASKVERNWDERDVGESEEICRSLVDLSPDPVVILQGDRYQFVSQAFTEVFGYTQKDIDDGLSFYELVQEHDKKSVRRRYEDRLKGKQLPKTYRIDLISKEGMVVSCETSARLIRYNGKPADLVLIRDITERKRIEEIPRKSEERYRAVVEDQSELICRFLPDKTLTFANSAYCRYFGLKQDELIGSSFMRLIPESEHEHIENHFASLSIESPAAMHEHRVIAPNGEIHWQQWTNRAIFDDENRIIEFQSVGRDITDRKRAEEELRQSEERYRVLVETIPHGVQEIDASGTITFVNSAHCKIHGYAEGELIGKSILDLVASDSEREKLSEYLATLVNEQPEPIPYVGQDRIKDGRIKDIQVDWDYKKDKDGGVIGFISVLTDITERKQAEVALRKAHDDMEQKVKERTSELLETNEQLRREIENRKGVETRLRESEAYIKGILNAAPAGIGLVNNRVFGWVSNRMSEMLGYSVDELIGQNARILYESDEEFERVGRVKYLEIQERGVGSVETRFKRKDGSVIDVLLCSSAVDPGDLSKGAIFTVLDITERKRVEEALRESEEKYRLLVDNLPSIVYKGYKHWSVEFFDEKIEVLTGHSMKEFNSGRMKWSDLVIEEDIAGARETFIKALKTDKSYVREYRIKARSGDILWIQERANIICDDKGEIDYVSGVFFDITERKIAEEILRANEERLRRLLEASPDPIVVYDVEGRATYVNPAFVETFGWSSRELLGKSIEFVPEENWPETRVAIARMLRGERIQSFETRRLTKAGRILDIQLSSSVFHDGDDRPAGNIVILRDVTKRKKGEEALRKSKAELAAQSRHLEEVNAALKVLLKRREEDKADLEERVLANVKELMLPYVERLKNSRLDSDQMTLVGILESNIQEVVSPFVTKLSSRYLSLTPTEIQVANLIRDGKSSKEIAALLNASENTVRSHRFHIRSKLDIKNKKVNLRSYLKSLHNK